MAMKFSTLKRWTRIPLTLVHIRTSELIEAKCCFELGIELKRIEVIADDEGEIIEAVRRMSGKYDMVVTSGGIGPTHDDIVLLSLLTWVNLRHIRVSPRHSIKV